MWHLDDAPWSSLFARRIAETIGYDLRDFASEVEAIPFSAETEEMVRTITETIRYLPPEKIQLALNFAAFLRAHRTTEGNEASSVRQSEVTKNLNEMRDLVLFLRSRYGQEQPADEKDYWTDEDRNEAQEEARRRLEERDLYPSAEIEDAHAG